MSYAKWRQFCLRLIVLIVCEPAASQRKEISFLQGVIAVTGYIYIYIYMIIVALLNHVRGHHSHTAGSHTAVVSGERRGGEKWNHWHLLLRVRIGYPAADHAGCEVGAQVRFNIKTRLISTGIPIMMIRRGGGGHSFCCSQ